MFCSEDNQVLPEIIQIWSPLIDFFRCCGIIPLKRSNHPPYFERCIGSYCVSLLLFTLIFFTSLITIIILKNNSQLSVIEILDIVLHLIYYSHCELTLAYFMLRSGDIIQLFQFWIDVERVLNEANIRLGRAIQVKCWVIYSFSIVILFSDNILFICSKV